MTGSPPKDRENRNRGRDGHRRNSKYRKYSNHSNTSHSKERNASGDKRLYCSYHGKNMTHSSEQCFQLQRQQQGNKHSGGSRHREASMFVSLSTAGLASTVPCAFIDSGSTEHVVSTKWLDAHNIRVKNVRTTETHTIETVGSDVSSSKIVDISIPVADAKNRVQWLGLRNVRVLNCERPLGLLLGRSGLSKCGATLDFAKHTLRLNGRVLQCRIADNGLYFFRILPQPPPDNAKGEAEGTRGAAPAASRGATAIPSPPVPVATQRKSILRNPGQAQPSATAASATATVSPVRQLRNAFAPRTAAATLIHNRFSALSAHEAGNSNP